MSVVQAALAALRKPDEPTTHQAAMRLALVTGYNFYQVEHWRTGRRPVAQKSEAFLREIVETYEAGQRREVSHAAGA